MNFFTTRCQYICEECARKQQGEGCDRLFAQVYSIIEKEREAKKQLPQEKERDFDNTDNEKEPGNENIIEPDEHEAKHSAGKQGDTQTTDVNRNHTNDKRKEKVCYYYRNNKCKYGLRGWDCPYAHPRLCNRYKVNGHDPVRGCKKGKDCTYLHPPICYGSEKKRECFNVECKKLHLKGTRRYPSYPPDQTTTGQQTRKQAVPDKQAGRPTRSTFTVPQPANQPYNAWESGPPHNSDKQQTESFLFQQMQQMQQTQQHILQMLKTMSSQWSNTHPLQGYQQVGTTVPPSFIK